MVEVPNCGMRYYTVQIAYADSSAEQSYGQRTHGPQLPPLFVQGPGDETPPPAGMWPSAARPGTACCRPGSCSIPPTRPISLRSTRCSNSSRPVLCGPTLLAVPVPDERRLVDPSTSPPPHLLFLHELGNVLRDWVVQPADRPWIDGLADIGLTTETGFRPGGLSTSTQVEIARGLSDGVEIVRNKSLSLGEDVDGWTVNRRGPRFGDDHLLRAGVAKDQIVVTVPEEALIPIARLDSEGRALYGSNGYRIRFPRGAEPPVDAFWSITLYGDDGFLVDNPLGRYAISDRTPGDCVAGGRRDPDRGGLHSTAGGGPGELAARSGIDVLLDAAPVHPTAGSPERDLEATGRPASNNLTGQRPPVSGRWSSDGLPEERAPGGGQRGSVPGQRRPETSTDRVPGNASGPSSAVNT